MRAAILIPAVLVMSGAAAQASEAVKPVTIADLTPGAEVRVMGTVLDITDEDEFRLADATGAVEVYIGPNAMPVDAGTKVTVIGQVDDDLPLEIYARTILLPDGRSIALSAQY